MILLVTAAFAREFLIPDDYYSIVEVTSIADPDELILITIDPSFTVSDDMVWVMGWDIAFRSADPSQTAFIPPIYADSGSSVTLENVRTERDTSWRTSAGTLEFGVMADNAASLTISGLEANGAGDHDVIVLNTDTTITGFTPSGNATDASVWVMEDGTGHGFSLTDSVFADQVGGAVKIEGAGSAVASLSGVSFEDNVGSGWADLSVSGANVEVDLATFADSSADGGNAAPVSLKSGALSISRSTVERTGTDGRFVTLISGALYVIESLLTTGATGPTFYAGASTTISLTSSTVDMAAATVQLAYSDGGSLALDHVDIVGEGRAGDLVALYVSGGELTMTHSRLCRLSAYEPVVAESSVVAVERSIFQGVTADASGAALALFDNIGSADVTLLNNSYLGTSGTAVHADLSGPFTSTNELYGWDDVGMWLPASLPTGGVDHTLWWQNTVDHEPSAGGGFFTGDLAADPKLQGSFDTTDCDTWPVPTASSPVKDAGSPSSPADGDGSDPDLGALYVGEAPDIGWHGPYDGSADTGDTGDTGEVDTGEVDTGETGEVDTGDTGDTGVIDTATPGDDPDGDGSTWTDCAPDDPSIHPGAEEIPNDGIDQDCNEEDGTLTLAGGACGCATGAAPSGVGLLMLAALSLRRRRA